SSCSFQFIDKHSCPKGKGNVGQESRDDGERDEDGATQAGGLSACPLGSDRFRNSAPQRNGAEWPSWSRSSRPAAYRDRLNCIIQNVRVGSNCLGPCCNCGFAAFH